MVNRCAVPGCPSRPSDLELSFYNIPHDPILLEQWNSSISLEQIGERLCSTMKVCSLHFQESDFWANSRGQKFLKKYAVPTVFDICTTNETSTKRVRKKPSAAKKSTKRSTNASSKKRTQTVSSMKREILPSTPQSQKINESSPSSGSEVCRKNIFIVRGSETFSVIVEKCNKSSSNKRPSEDEDVEWKAKRVVRLPDCNFSRKLIENARLSAEVEQTNKLVQPPGGSPSLPTAKSVLEKTGVISESAVIPALSEPASPEEGSMLEEADVVSELKEVTPVPSQVQKPQLVCAECKKRNVILEPHRIAHNFTVFLCPTEECVYPLGEENFYRFLYRNMPNNFLQRCTPDEAPTLDEIVAMISAAGR